MKGAKVPPPVFSIQQSSGKGLKICISDSFFGGANITDPESTHLKSFKWFYSLLKILLRHLMQRLSRLMKHGVVFQHIQLASTDDIRAGTISTSLSLLCGWSPQAPLVWIFIKSTIGHWGLQWPHYAVGCHNFFISVIESFSPLLPSLPFLPSSNYWSTFSLTSFTLLILT